MPQNRRPPGLDEVLHQIRLRAVDDILNCVGQQRRRRRWQRLQRKDAPPSRLLRDGQQGLGQVGFRYIQQRPVHVGEAGLGAQIGKIWRAVWRRRLGHGRPLQPPLTRQVQQVLHHAVPGRRQVMLSDLTEKADLGSEELLHSFRHVAEDALAHGLRQRRHHSDQVELLHFPQEDLQAAIGQVNEAPQIRRLGDGDQLLPLAQAVGAGKGMLCFLTGKLKLGELVSGQTAGARQMRGDAWRCVEMRSMASGSPAWKARCRSRASVRRNSTLARSGSVLAEVDMVHPRPWLACCPLLQAGGR